VGHRTSDQGRSEHELSNTTDGAINRRRMLAGLAGAGVVALGASAGPAKATPSTEWRSASWPEGPTTSAGERREELIPAQTSWDPVPPMTGSRGQVQIPDVRLAVWDTGGDGTPVVLMHPHSGHGGVWGYQQAAFAEAGHRVISYSRRGYQGSEPLVGRVAGTDLRDLIALMDALGVGQFHLVGLAAGGNAVFDAALSIPERLLSVIVGCTIGGIQDPQWAAVTQRLIAGGFLDLPAEFQELGPSYRAAAPEALEEWRANEELPKPATPLPGTQNTLSWSNIETITTPTQLFTGDADMYFPPSRLREMAGHLPSAEVAVFAEVGHCPHWESYRAFNDMVLSFVREHEDRRHGR
jgi:pimeloyl-ACP methyl ester carboxylesterase